MIIGFTNEVPCKALLSRYLFGQALPLCTERHDRVIM